MLGSLLFWVGFQLDRLAFVFFRASRSLSTPPVPDALSTPPAPRPFLTKVAASPELDVTLHLPPGWTAHVVPDFPPLGDVRSLGLVVNDDTPNVVAIQCIP